MANIFRFSFFLKVQMCKEQAGLLFSSLGRVQIIPCLII